MSQELKQSLTPIVKRVLKKYNLKGTLSVNHHATLVLKITEGEIDFIGNYNVKYKMDDYLKVNVYYYHEHFSGKALECINALIHAMNTGNHDRSDIQSDYFDVGWYIDINIGSYDKPYKLRS